MGGPGTGAGSMIDPSRPIAVDHVHRSVSVPKRLMPAILTLHAGEKVRSAETVAELEAGGLLLRNELDPLVVTLVTVMTNPTMVVTVESTRTHSSRLATIWGYSGCAVLGTTVDQHQFDLLQIEPNLLPFHLAQVTELTPRSQPPFTGSVTVPRATLRLVEDTIAQDQQAAEQELRAAGLVDPWPDWLLIALAHRRALWTIEVIWFDGATRRVERMTVLDAGAAGYWTVGENPGRDTVTLCVRDFDHVLRRCSALLAAAAR